MVLLVLPYDLVVCPRLLLSLPYSTGGQIEKINESKNTNQDY